jgi:hypothetical protein
MWGNTIVIHSVLKEKTTKLKNKIDKDNSEKKSLKKTMWGNTVAIYSVLKKKTKFSTSSIVKKNRQK